MSGPRAAAASTEWSDSTAPLYAPSSYRVRSTRTRLRRNIEMACWISVCQRRRKARGGELELLFEVPDGRHPPVRNDGSPRNESARQPGDASRRRTPVYLGAPSSDPDRSDAQASQERMERGCASLRQSARQVAPCLNQSRLPRMASERIREHVRRCRSSRRGTSARIRRFEGPYLKPKRRNDTLRQVEALKRENIVVRDCEGGHLSGLLLVVSGEWPGPERPDWVL